MATATTKMRILNASLDLFNQSGTAEMTTNHIAAATGISPGNLYYHFRNKDEIIRAIIEHLLAEFDDFWKTARTPTIEHLQEMVHDSFALQWRYRFFLRERVALLRNDPVLAQRYQEIFQQRMVQQTATVQHFIAAGVVHKPVDPTELHHLGVILWILNENWLTFLESIGQPIDAEHFHEGSATVLSLLRLYFTENNMVGE